MKSREILSIVLILFILQACRNPDHTNNAVINDSTLDQIMTDTTAINRGAGIAVFLKDAASAGMMEVEVSNLAVQKASDPEVQKFAVKMVKDHTKVNVGLKKLAETKGVALTAVLSPTDQKHVDEMKNMSGANFDKHYMSMMVTDHIKAIDLFKSATTSGDIDVRKFTAKTLRVIEGHYKTAIEVNSSLK